MALLLKSNHWPTGTPPQCGILYFVRFRHSEVGHLIENLAAKAHLDLLAA